VAQVLEQNPALRYVSIVNAQPGKGASQLFAPAIFNLAYGNFVTGEGIINPTSNPITLTVSYYNTSGTLFSSSPFTLAPNAVANIYNPATTGIGVPAEGLPSGFVGVASVSVSGGTALMTVNEFGGYTSSGTTESGTYTAASQGSTTLGLPVIANGGYGYTTGTTIFNISNASVSGTLQYYSTSGVAVGNPHPFSINPHSSQVFYQGDPAQALTNGFYGVAVISQNSGPANALVDTTNAISAGFFYTYVEPTN
jgi:hypothetical protein